MNVLADGGGVAFLAIVTVAACKLTPESVLPPPMYFFVFLALAVSALHIWHRYSGDDPLRTWLRNLTQLLLSFIAIALIGAAFSYAKGVHGGAYELISSNGTYFLIAFVLPLFIVGAAGGLIRAVIFSVLTRKPSATKLQQ